MLATMLIAALLVAPAEPAKADAGAEKMICKRKPVTGSRVRFNKVCMTAADWRRAREAGSRELREAVDRSMQSQLPPATSDK